LYWCNVLILICIAHQSACLENKTLDDNPSRDKRVMSVFNVVTFPNTACGSSSGYNGTCYTSSECTSKGGTASGTCASSFGVCCVFSLACGATTSENNTYALMDEFSISSDSDPCAYTFCPLSSDVCKLKFDFDILVLEGPFSYSSTNADVDSANSNGPLFGDCFYDTLTVTNPGGAVPPTICGYNTGQHMYVPASSSCNTLNINIDTGTTTTTRKWQIKITQYECTNQRAPEQDCLQYFTAEKGTIASFNWDTSASSVATTQTHLSNQKYSICFRRQRNYCSICFSPQILSTTDGTASSYGLSAGSVAATQTSAIDGFCTGQTQGGGPAADPVVGFGDYLEIANIQPSIGTTGTVGATRMCGVLWEANTIAAIAQATACSWSTPFKVGVHFDEGENIWEEANAAGNLEKVENDPAATGGAGFGYSGFYLAYWQNSC